MRPRLRKLGFELGLGLGLTSWRKVTGFLGRNFVQVEMSELGVK
jgi:hypothetical protein